MSKKKKSEQAGTPVPLGDAVTSPAPDRMVDGVPVRTYRGTSLAALAPQIRAELGDSAMILRQREGVTGGIAGFFAKRMVEIDVAVIVAQSPGSRIDTTDGPSVGPQQRLLVDPPRRSDQPTGAFSPQLDDPAAAPALQPTVPFSAIAEQHGLGDARAAAAEANASAPSDYGMFSAGLGAPAVPPGVPLTQPTSPQHPFSVGMPSAADAANIEAQLAAGSAERAAHQATHEPSLGPDVGAPPPASVNRAPMSESQIGDRPAAAAPAAARPTVNEPVPFVPPVIEPEPDLVPEPVARHQPVSEPEPFVPPTSSSAFDSPFDPGRGGADPAPVDQTHESFEDRVRIAGLAGVTDADPVAQLGHLHGLLLRRGLPDQIASPVVDDTLLHRAALQPGRPVSELLASELARRIPTAPLAGRAGQAVAFVGSSGAGKTRAIARLAAAYGAAARVPVACVTLQDSGQDGLLATSLAPFGIAVHAAPDAPRALDRITALRRTCLVLVDTPGVSPGDTAAVDRLGTTLELLELDQVALCLPVVLAAPIARRVLRAMRPLGPTLLVATHADEADLLGGVVAVSIDRRVPIAYVSAGAGRGGIIGADAHHIATELLQAEPAVGPSSAKPAAMRTPGRRAITPVDRTHDAGSPEPAPESTPEPARQSSPAIDVAAGAAHLAVPWIMSSPRRPGRRGQ